MYVGGVLTIDEDPKVIPTVVVEAKSEPSWILNGNGILLSPVGVLFTGTGSKIIDGELAVRSGFSTMLV